ncbi:molybdenum cofactor guanylyltransferase [Deinococcus sp. KNUC1210]|uniref:molybdenum cofactor guanylyltransferase n=1 Tax=Deinococcus sp. KNUC1210 TaxID=2917691 RepID=UPI001EF0E628|nr:molybdenum cofactor guanylyltransferase [Deinococcus sp. KNUC1210]ULH15725.1 molybdenum cofactor guanylyltransferase [Deinococcus sp. KNUC1210]
MPAAAITAGGQSRRFGQDKALFVIGGQTLLERVAGSLTHFEPRLLVAPAGKYVQDGWQHLPDTRPGAGPLAGLEAALGAAPPGWLAFSAVDLPFLTQAYWTRLTDAVQPDVQAVYGLDASGRRQPLAALYRTAALPTVTALLDAGERRMLALLDALPGVALEWAQLQIFGERLYQNLNTPESAENAVRQRPILSSNEP